MDFAFSDEQEQLRGFARDFLAERYDDVTIAKLADSATGVDEDVWPKLTEMGWLDDELTFLDHAVLLEESAYRLLPAPYFATVALAGRTDRSTLAWAEAGRPQGLLDPVEASVVSGRLTGEKILVPDGHAVDRFVVVAQDGLYIAEDGEVTPQGAIDGTRRLATVRFDGVPATKIGDLDGLGAIRDRAYAAAALECVGVAQRALDLLVAYAKEREQFGKPIGVYQAISHKASNVYVRLQEARSLAYWAAWCVAEGDPQAHQAALAAKALAGEAAVFACENAIQGHGGIGFTWEHVLHRYYKRAQWLAAFDGPARAQRAEVAALLLD